MVDIFGAEQDRIGWIDWQRGCPSRECCSCAGVTFGFLCHSGFAVELYANVFILLILGVKGLLEIFQDEELEEYQGFVITGSCSDAHGNDPWVCKLVTLLKKLDSLHKKLLGFCFGHQVWELPKRAEVMACTKKTGIEMFRCGDHIMGIQGHPEYSKDVLLHFIDRLQGCHLIQSGHVELAKASMEACVPNH